MQSMMYYKLAKIQFEQIHIVSYTQKRQNCGSKYSEQCRFFIFLKFIRFYHIYTAYNSDSFACL
jgi:hypothetical protein